MGPLMVYGIEGLREVRDVRDECDAWREIIAGRARKRSEWEVIVGSDNWGNGSGSGDFVEEEL